jgi:transcriptional regulator with XRE-family HTH domain
MADKFSSTVKALRKALGMTQVEFAQKLGVGVPSVTHYETASRRPDPATTARLARAAHEAGRDDLAEVFAEVLPGVRAGLLVPVWRLPKEQQPALLPSSRKSRSAAGTPTRICQPIGSGWSSRNKSRCLAI